MGWLYYSITFKFKLTQAQLDALRCIAPYIELDFHMKNFNVPTGYPIGWDAYKLAGTNLPGAIHDDAIETTGRFRYMVAVRMGGDELKTLA
ncbi:MAG TPA: hypothetical protein VI322_04010 [Candidatus Saccharimonadia bacterium]